MSFYITGNPERDFSEILVFKKVFHCKVNFVSKKKKIKIKYFSIIYQVVHYAFCYFLKKIILIVRKAIYKYPTF